MLNRWIGIVCAACMLSVNAALIFRDFVPEWIAGDPPEPLGGRLGIDDVREIQVGIFDQRGILIGRSWTVCRPSTEMVRVFSWTIVRPVPLPGGMVTPSIRIDTDTVYKPDGQIDSLDIHVHGLDIPIQLKGEFMPPDNFPCEWHVGEQIGRFVLDADTTRALGDVFRPFDNLPGMYVGRSWKLQVFNPLAQLMPGLKDTEPTGEKVLVRVTALEEILYLGRKVEAYRVELPKVRAWVGHDGQVLRQEVDLPLFGRLTLLDQPFDEELRKRKVQEFMSGN